MGRRGGDQNLKWDKQKAFSYESIYVFVFKKHANKNYNSTKYN